MIASYNASAVKMYNARSSLVPFENKNIFFCSEKRSSLLCTYNAGVAVVNSEVVGLGPGSNIHVCVKIWVFGVIK
jgi:hypothetical protein